VIPSGTSVEDAYVVGLWVLGRGAI
jgi:hypothetical protein